MLTGFTRQRNPVAGQTTEKAGKVIYKDPKILPAFHMARSERACGVLSREIIWIQAKARPWPR